MTAGKEDKNREMIISKIRNLDPNRPYLIFVSTEKETNSVISAVENIDEKNAPILLHNLHTTIDEDMKKHLAVQSAWKNSGKTSKEFFDSEGSK